MDVHELADVLYDAGVFYNGIRGKEHKAHMDSYMTCIEWSKLFEVWGSIKDTITKEQWIEIANYYQSHAYCSRNCGILASFIKNEFE